MGVLRPLRLVAEAVISLNTCLDAPILSPLSREDLGVKKRVNDRGVIVGALRGLLLWWSLGGGRIGDEARSPSIDAALLDRTFSCEPIGVRSSIVAVSKSHSNSPIVQMPSVPYSNKKPTRRSLRGFATVESAFKRCRAFSKSETRRG